LPEVVRSSASLALLNEIQNVQQMVVQRENSKADHGGDRDSSTKQLYITLTKQTTAQTYTQTTN